MSEPLGGAPKGRGREPTNDLPIRTAFNVYEALGYDAVVIPLCSGSKRPKHTEWQKTTLAQSRSPEHQRELQNGEIGVVLGSAGNGICTIDLDTDEAAADFLAANPRLAGTLQTRGRRGLNLWFRLHGRIPRSGALNSNGKQVGEFRAAGCHTKILGQHPKTGLPYTWPVDAPALSILFDEIVWPTSWSGASINDSQSTPAPAHGALSGDIRAPAAAPAIDPDIADLATLSPPPDETFTEGDRDDLLGHLDPDMSYPDWIRMAAGMKHQFGDSAYEKFDSWSATGKKYVNGADTRKLWDSLKRTLPGRPSVTIGTLIAKAQANGYVRRKPKPASGDSMIILPSADVSITAAANKLFQKIAASETLFYRGGRVHEIIEEPGTGDHRLSPISSMKFRSQMENYGSLLVWRKGGNSEVVLKPTTCPDETAKALLESAPAGKLLPNVALLSACPILVRDGLNCCVLGPGWHPENGGIYITGGQTPPDVPLADALADLPKLVADFDFSTPGDESRAIAALIGPALKFGGWLTGPLPIDIAEADVSQAGKGYRQKCVAGIYREVPNIVTQKTSGVGGLDESISQKLIDGRPFILIDNLRGKLDSQFLEAALTAPGPMPARVPHRGEVLVDPRSFVFQITSNGVEATKDLLNRASIIRIRKRPQGYLFKVYPEGDVYAHIKAHQPYYLGCVFAVIKYWQQQGERRTTESRHDNREWAQKLDWIVQNIFFEAPLLEGFAAAQQRASNPRSSWVRAIAIEVKGAGTTGPLTASQLAEISSDSGLEVPGVGRDADEKAQAQAIGRIMANTFGPSDEHEVDGHKIHRIHGTNPNTGNPSKSYVFE